MSSLKTEIDNVPKAQRLPEREERNVKIGNLSEKQKGLLGAAGAGVAGVSLGVIAMTLMGAAIPEENGEIKPPAPTNLGGKEEVEVTIHTDAPFADGVDDSMSFGEAFKTAREEVGAGGIFEWRGNLYNTYIKSEWDAMDKGERAEFFASIDKDFLPGDEDKEAEIIKIVNDDTRQIDDTEDIVIVDDPKAPNGGEPSDDDEIVVVEPTDDKPSDDDEIVLIDQTGDEEIVVVPDNDNLDGGDGFGINPDSDSPDFYNDDISIVDEA